MTTLDTAGFVQNIFTVRLAPEFSGTPSGDFSTYAQIIGYNTQNDDPSDKNTSPNRPGHDPTITRILTDINNEWSASPQYFSKGKCRDTSLGGNDAINCYSQFNETDDVAEHPFLVTTAGGTPTGMGRVYSEVYDDQQQIMYLTFGVPQFNQLTSFYSKAIVEDLARLMNNGQDSIAGGLMGLMTGAVVATFISLPAMPLAFIFNILGGLDTVPITKYYDFKSAMPLYYRCVDSMVLHLAINMGLTKDTFLLSPQSSRTAGGNISSLSVEEQVKQSIQTNAGTPTSGLPEIFGKYGFSIYKLLCKKYKYMDGSFNGPAQSSDEALRGGDQLTDVTSGNFQQNFVTAFNSQLYDATMFIGFRIEKGADNSESVANETGESSIAQQINSKAQSGRDARFATADGNFDGGGLVDSLMGAVSSIVSGLADATIGKSIKSVIAGAGVIDIPDVWKSSSFSKSYHFNMSLRSPYGDPYSIMQNLYIPLAMLVAGGFPRGIGQAAYTAPFVCRAYCKGMFAVPLGMITSMSIKRGADQFGWNTQRLPTCIDISFEIKDLSPAMYLAAGEGGTWEALKDCFSANSNFQEYLMTLSGMGLADRLVWTRNLRRKAQYLMGQVTTSKFSPFYWGATLGNTLPARMLSAFVPSTRLPNS